jgi:hypothetical protein
MVLATNTLDCSLVKAGNYISIAHEVFRWFPLARRLCEVKNIQGTELLQTDAESLRAQRFAEQAR